MRKAFKNFVESFKKDEKGMTLVELLAVIVILAIVGAIAFVAIGNVIDNSKKDAQLSNAEQAFSAAKLYEATNGELGEDDELVSGEDGNLVDYLEAVFDPWEKDDLLKLTITRPASGELHVQIANSEECSFTATEETLRSQGRELCTTGGIETGGDEGEGAA